MTINALEARLRASAVDDAACNREAHPSSRRSSPLGQEAIVVLGAQGQLRNANRAAEDLLGYQLRDRRETNGLDLVHPDDLALALLAFTETSAELGVTVPIRLRLRHGAGTWLLVEAVADNRLDDPTSPGIGLSLSPVSSVTAAT